MPHLQQQAQALVQRARVLAKVQMGVLTLTGKLPPSVCEDGAARCCSVGWANHGPDCLRGNTARGVAPLPRILLILLRQLFESVLLVAGAPGCHGRCLLVNKRPRVNYSMQTLMPRSAAWCSVCAFLMSSADHVMILCYVP